MEEVKLKIIDLLENENNYFYRMEEVSSVC